MNTFTSDPLIQKVKSYITHYMKNYDASHDIHHITRVVNLSHHIYTHSPNKFSLDLRVIHLSALLHDVGDKKYLLPNQDPSTLISSLLTSFDCPSDLASKIQEICLGVSYSSEIKDPERVKRLIEKYPELAVVQDADRLDAIGAVGIGRMFTFGGAKGGRTLEETMGHLDEKLVLLEDMMKTGIGRMMARERTERLEMFRGWWGEEVEVGVEGEEEVEEVD
ncbi:hypothetical protein QBC38DRAFT_361154 [Podospora fimiseda]|uniref:HD/PDEase domain-containing protein n=1 Tax=Podospora fimiseda TaxID=252190 RepID=A0AAN7H1L1_9PEZI|nr:hypothetical protein QBC38DRAFT_361154 [Podospora fimiseda]